jgi:hypothetical protein
LRIFYFFTLFIFLGCQSKESVVNRSLEDISKVLLEALQKKDAQKIKVLLPNAEVLKVFYKNQQTESNLDEKTLQQLSKKLEQSLEKDFQILLYECDSRYILLPQCKIAKVDDPLTKKKDVLTQELLITFNFNKQSFRVSLQTIKIEDQWYIMDNLKGIFYNSPTKKPSNKKKGD